MQATFGAKSNLGSAPSPPQVSLVLTLSETQRDLRDLMDVMTQGNIGACSSRRNKPPTPSPSCSSRDGLSWRCGIKMTHYCVPPYCERTCMGFGRVCMGPRPTDQTFIKLHRSISSSGWKQGILQRPRSHELALGQAAIRHRRCDGRLLWRRVHHGDQEGMEPWV